MIYSKTKGNQPNHCGFYKLSDLADCKLEPGAIYWYDQHDYSVRNLEFNDFVDEQHWDHIRTDPTAKILLFFGNEYFNTKDIDVWVTTLRDRKVPFDRFWIVTINSEWTKWAQKMFADRGAADVHIDHYNLMLKNLKRVPPFDGKVAYKFSGLVRNYGDWRLKIFAELKNRNLLKDFCYTFNNVNPYTSPITVFEKEDLKQRLDSFGYNDAKIKAWVDGMPYQFKNDTFDKWSDRTFDIIKMSKIHMLVESHFDPFWNFYNTRGTIAPEVFSPSFPTEKTWKVIFCQRPFIAFSTPYFMKELRDLGFQTFSPYINEEYDSIVDDDKRLLAIASEFERLSKLNDEQMNEVVAGCQAAVDYNYDFAVKLRKEVAYSKPFAWVTPYMAEHLPLKDFILKL